MYQEDRYGPPGIFIQKSDACSGMNDRITVLEQSIPKQPILGVWKSNSNGATDTSYIYPSEVSSDNISKIHVTFNDTLYCKKDANVQYSTTYIAGKTVDMIYGTEIKIFGDNDGITFVSNVYLTLLSTSLKIDCRGSFTNVYIYWNLNLEIYPK